MNITYKENHRFNQGSDEYQACRVILDEVEMTNILHYTYFPHNVFKEVKSWYEIGGFDCLDENYNEKLYEFKQIANPLDVEVIEDESIFFCLPDDTSAEKLHEVSKKVSDAMNMVDALAISVCN